MLIYEINDKIYCYIHIPKNSGKFIRKTIENNKKNKILIKLWGCDLTHYDKAHIPFMLKNNFIDNLDLENINYYTYVRNPYNRIISAFFYKNKGKKIKDFKQFVKKDLKKINFDKKFDKNLIHYYPQYMFICDTDFKISKVKFDKLENKKEYNIKKYNLIDYFDLETIKIINEIYKTDFEMFDYKLLSNI